MRLLVCAIVIAAAVSNSMATDIGLSGAKAWTSHADVGDPLGFSIYIAEPISKELKLQLEYSHSRHERDVRAYLGLPLPEQTEPPLYRSENTLDAFGLDLLIRPARVAMFDFEFGPEISVNRLKCDRTGIDSASRHAHKSATRLGIALLTRLSMQPTSSATITTYIAFKAKNIFGSDTRMTDSWEPYDDGIGLLELSIGIAFGFH